MSSPDVAAAAALVIASGVIGPNPSPDQDPRQARADGRSRSADRSPNQYYGYGLLDVGAATSRTTAPRSSSRRRSVR